MLGAAWVGWLETTGGTPVPLPAGLRGVITGMTWMRPEQNSFHSVPTERPRRGILPACPAAPARYWRTGRPRHRWSAMRRRAAAPGRQASGWARWEPAGVSGVGGMRSRAGGGTAGERGMSVGRMGPAPAGKPPAASAPPGGAGTPMMGVGMPAAAGRRRGHQAGPLAPAQGCRWAPSACRPCRKPRPVRPLHRASRPGVQGPRQPANRRESSVGSCRGSSVPVRADGRAHRRPCGRRRGRAAGSTWALPGGRPSKARHRSGARLCIPRPRAMPSFTGAATWKCPGAARRPPPVRLAAGPAMGPAVGPGPEQNFPHDPTLDSRRFAGWRGPCTPGRDARAAAAPGGASGMGGTLLWCPRQPVPVPSWSGLVPGGARTAAASRCPSLACRRRQAVRMRRAVCRPVRAPCGQLTSPAHPLSRRRPWSRASRRPRRPPRWFPACPPRRLASRCRRPRPHPRRPPGAAGGPSANIAPGAAGQAGKLSPSVAAPLAQNEMGSCSGLRASKSCP